MQLIMKKSYALLNSKNINYMRYVKLSFSLSLTTRLDLAKNAKKNEDLPLNPSRPCHVNPY